MSWGSFALVKPSVDLLFATLSSRPASRAASSGPAWNRAAAGDWGEVERVGDAAGWDSLTAEAASAGLRTVLRTAPLPPYLFTTSFTEAANESQLGGQDVRRRASAALQHGVAEGESLTLQPAVALRGAKPQTRDWHAIRLRKAIWLEAANGRPVAPAELDRRRAIQQRFEAGVAAACEQLPEDSADRVVLRLLVDGCVELEPISHLAPLQVSPPAVGAHAPGCSLRGSVFLLWVLAPLGACTSPIPHLPRGPPSPR
jgi:hypothetical protein